MRSLFLASLFLSITCAAGCTKGSYVAGDGGDLADSGDTSIADSAAPDAPVITTDAGDLPAQSFEGLYFGACLTKLAAGRVDRVLLFYTKVKATPSTVTLELTALKVGPTTVSKSATVGQTYTVTNALLAPSGAYVAPLGTISIPGEANPISGREIVIEQTAIPGKLSVAKFCSQMSGHVVTPTDITLEGPSNTCIYLPVKEGGPTPVLNTDGSDFPDTCALN